MTTPSVPEALPRERLDAALRQALAVDGVVGSVIATRDGSLVARAVDDELIAQTLAATTAAIFGRLAEVSARLGLGTVSAVLTDTSTHALQFMPVGTAVLAVLARRNQNVRQIREAMRSVAVALASQPALNPPREGAG